MTTSYKEIEYNPDLYDADYEQPKFDTGISKKIKMEYWIIMYKDIKVKWLNIH